MTTLVVLILLEVVLGAYVGTRVLRYSAAPSPTLRGAILTAGSLLVAMLAVTEPVEVLLRGPGASTVAMPTVLKHLGILGCAVGVLLMALAQRKRYRPQVEYAIWAVFGAAGVSMVVLHVVPGGGGHRTSVDYVEWSHTQPLLLLAMLIAYIGGLVASIGLLVVIWPPRLQTAAGRGLSIMACGSVLLAGWCVVRVQYLWQSTIATDSPADEDFLITQLLSVVGMLLLTVGLVWSTAEADLVAWRHWRKFRELHARVVEVLPEVRRRSDARLGFDTWVVDRAVELLDGLHQIEQVAGTETGFPRPPETVSEGEMTAVAERLGRAYREDKAWA
ncbi:hypothetical protein ACWIDS_17995 [Dietzia maris]